MERYQEYKDSGEQWLGEIPSHWEVRKAKFLWTETESRSENGEETLLSVSQYDGVKPTSDESRSESLEGYKIVNQNDLVVNIMLAWLGGLGISSYKGIVSPAYCVYKLKDNQIPKYLHYLYKTPMYLAEFARRSTGIVPSRWRMYTDDFGQVLTILPPLSEQTAMVTYLDRVTSQIDKAIAQQQRMIDLLNERKQIIIQHAVTKGLDPKAEMVESGVEWIGKMPKGWKIIKLKYCCSVKGRVGWNGLNSDEFEEESFAYLVTGQDFKGDKIEWNKCYQINKRRYEEDPYIQLKNGDILITKDGTIGKIAKVQGLEKPACLNSGIFLLKQTKELFTQDFLYWMLLSNVLKEFNNYTQTGATILHLYQNVFINMPCIVPNVEAQRHIAMYLNTRCAVIDKEINKHETLIKALRERKQIIINEVVTGKVKVS